MHYQDMGLGHSASDFLDMPGTPTEKKGTAAPCRLPLYHYEDIAHILIASQGEDNVMLLGHAPHVQYGISHAAQSGVDAHAGRVGNLFETHIHVITHGEHFALALGQRTDEASHIAVNLRHDQIILDRTV